MNQAQVYPAAGDIINTEYFGPDKTGAAHHVSSENEQAVATSGPAILERDAESKGSWFAYLKTRQFWITLVLGQGKSLSLGAKHDITIECRFALKLNGSNRLTIEPEIQSSRFVLHLPILCPHFSAMKALPFLPSNPFSTTSYST